MLQLTGTRATLLLLECTRCSRFRVWPQSYCAQATPLLLQSTPSHYVSKVQKPHPSSAHKQIVPRGYLTSLPGNVDAKSKSTILPSPFLLFQRHFSTTVPSLLSADKKSTQPKQSSIADLGYIPVYKFKYIVHANTLCRFKLFQTALVTSLVPLYFCLGLYPGSLQFWGLISSMTFAGLMLCVMGEFFRKFVGIVYYHPSKETVCVSHLTFWGNRKDEFFELADVVPVGDCEGNLNDIYLKMGLYSDPSRIFYISFRLGEVLNKEYFSEVFGCLPK